VKGGGKNPKSVLFEKVPLAFYPQILHGGGGGEDSHHNHDGAKGTHVVLIMVDGRIFVHYSRNETSKIQVEGKNGGNAGGKKAPNKLTSRRKKKTTPT